MNVIILIYLIGIGLCGIIYPIITPTDFYGDIVEIIVNIMKGFLIGIFWPLLIIILSIRRIITGDWI